MKLAALTAVFVLGATGMVSAQQEPVDHYVFTDKDNTSQQPQQSLITCSYNSNGAYLGADTPNPGVQAGGPVRTPNGTWAYTIAAPDGRSCPSSVSIPQN